MYLNETNQVLNINTNKTENVTG